MQWLHIVNTSQFCFFYFVKLTLFVCFSISQAELKCGFHHCTVHLHSSRKSEAGLASEGGPNFHRDIISAHRKREQTSSWQFEHHKRDSQNFRWWGYTWMCNKYVTVDRYPFLLFCPKTNWFHGAHFTVFKWQTLLSGTEGILRSSHNGLLLPFVDSKNYWKTKLCYTDEGWKLNKPNGWKIRQRSL